MDRKSKVAAWIKARSRVKVRVLEVSHPERKSGRRAGLKWRSFNTSKKACLIHARNLQVVIGSRK